MIRHRHTLTLAAALMIASITAGHAASAQQRTLYGSDGKVVGQSVTGSNGAVTHYGADGRVISREAITRDGKTIYDGQSGRVIGKTTNEKR